MSATSSRRTLRRLQRDLRAIARALDLKDEQHAYDIVRGFSQGELSREVQILLESLFE